MSIDFSDVEYWEARFQTEAGPFEWLQSPGAFLPHIRGVLESVPECDQNVLHIGPGSSTLSLSLRGLVAEPSRIHNVDYSQFATNLGQDVETKAFPNDKGNSMRWTCLSLLDTRSIMKLMDDELFDPQYSLVVDKSTADAVACGPDVILQPGLFRTNSVKPLVGTSGLTPSFYTATLHPVDVLALHLAVLTAPGARWLCLSYSTERFNFGNNQVEQLHAVPMLDPARFWSIKHKEPIVVEGSDNNPSSRKSPVHRPQITYWLYTLVRTKENLGLFSTG